MVYVTGDLHGDLSRFRSREFRKLKRKDTLIVCGDFGFLWEGTEREKKLLHWIGKRKYTVLFVEGVHDNLSLVEAYPEAEWNGGKVREISGKLRHLGRGGVFTIERRRIFVFGGGEDSESEGSDVQAKWWDKMLPSSEEIAVAQDNLKSVGDKVDYIITHQCSRRLKKFLTMRENEANVLDTFFDHLQQTCTFKAWFFGSYHIDKAIPPNAMAVFQRVVPLPENDFDMSTVNARRGRR
ncbi:MAG: metallophosphoesterase [Oscillospiraceae bacterium]